jgi:hypothetical protein
VDGFSHRLRTDAAVVPSLQVTPQAEMLEKHANAFASTEIAKALPRFASTKFATSSLQQA